MKGYIAGIFLLIFSCSFVHAESVLLQEIEVKAEKETLTESLEVREVRETNAKDVGEALQSIEGMNKIRKGGIANDIVLRGFQRDNIKVLVDGAQIHGACPNRMDPPSFHVDFAEIDRVDVMKGAFDIRNPGSLAGTVDIKTRSASPGFHGELNVNYGSFESFSGSGNLSYGTERYGLLGGLSYRRSDPYEDGDGRKFTELYPEASPNRYRDSEQDEKAYSIVTGWTKLSFAPAKDNLVEISYTRQEADDVLYPYLLMDANYDDADRLNFIYLVDDISSAVSHAKVQFYWNEVKHSMTDDKRCSSTANPAGCMGGLPRSYSMKTSASTETAGGKIESVLRIFGETAVGVDYYLRNWDTATTLRKMAVYEDQASVPDVDTTNVGIFIEQKSSVTNALVLTAGLRFDTTKTEADKDRTAVYDLYFPGSDRSKTDTSLSGKIELNYAVSGSLDLFGGFGHTVRVPDPIERYFALLKAGTAAKPDWVGNPGLHKVENNEIDLGVKYSTGKVFTKAVLFYSYVDDFIITRDISNGTRHATTYRNIDAELYGGEATARVVVVEDLYVSAGIGYTRGKNKTEDTDLPEIPPLKGMVSLRFDNDTYFSEVQGVFAATQDQVDSAVDESETSGWAILNLKGGLQFKGFKFFAGIENLLDNKYSEHLSFKRDPFASGIKVTEPGRVFYADLQYVF